MLLIHPVVFEAMKNSGKVSGPPAADAKRQFKFGHPVFGDMFSIPFRVSEYALVWCPPDDPFIEYEESDYAWLRAMGYGGWKPGAIEVADGASILWNLEGPPLPLSLSDGVRGCVRNG